MKSHGRLSLSSLLLRETLKGLQISAIGCYEVVVLRGFDDHRDPSQAGISDQVAKRFEADRPLADVLVTVHAASQFLLAVVDVNDLEGGDAHDLIEYTENAVIIVKGPDVVAGSKQMAGIQADTGSLRQSDLIQEQRDLLEAMPQRGSLTGSRFENHLDPAALRSLQEFPETVRHLS